MERVDFIFSYWIFVWYILFYLGILSTYNPTFAIVVGLVENAIILCLMLYYHTKYSLVIAFCSMVILLKIIPLYTIWNNTTITCQDILATMVLFLLYLVWIIVNNKSMDDFSKHTKQMILHNKNTLPGMVFLTNIGNYVQECVVKIWK